MSSSIENGISVTNLYEDNVKVSTIENESESAEARGGQGNGRLMTWDFGRTATLNIQDALLSDQSLAALSGNSVKTTGITAVGREVLTVADGKVSLKETPKGNVSVYKTQGGIMTQEITGATVQGKEVTITGAGAEDGDRVMVFYEYNVTDQEATQITFSSDAFPATYRVVGDTVVRGEDGVNRKMQFQIPKAKLQSGFSLTMDAENVATFDFNLDVLIDTETKELYKIVRLG